LPFCEGDEEMAPTIEFMVFYSLSKTIVRGLFCKGVARHLSENSSGGKISRTPNFNISVVAGDARNGLAEDWE
jgi:hypothetical protein